MTATTRALLPSIADVIFLSIFLILAFRNGGVLLADADTGYHIRAGEYILDTFSIPKEDIFSFLSPPPRWTAHEWLSEVIMALVHNFFGLTGVVLFFSLIIAACYSLLFKSLHNHHEDILVAMFLTWFAVVSSNLHWLARPHIFSLLLTIVWYSLLNAYQHRGNNLLFLLPVIMLLWVNLHAGFIVGFFLLAIYCFGNLWSSFSGKDDAERLQNKRRYKHFVIITSACLLVALINPYGYHILLFPFELISDKFLMDHVKEFISPNFHDPLPFKYLFLLLLGVLAISRFNVGIIELGLIILFTYMALYSARYITLFSIIIAPILLTQFQLFLNQSNARVTTYFKRKSHGISVSDGSVVGFLWPTIAILFVSISGINSSIEFGFHRDHKPIAAVEFLRREKIPGNMFNDDEFGDYIIYAAWPQYKVFTDGRSDMYGTQQMKEYFRIAYIKSGWESVLEKYDIRWIIFNTDSVLCRYLTTRNDWRLIYSDRVASIFVKNITEYQKLIEKYPHVELIEYEDPKLAT